MSRDKRVAQNLITKLSEGVSNSTAQMAIFLIVDDKREALRLQAIRDGNSCARGRENREGARIAQIQLTWSIADQIRTG